MNGGTMGTTIVIPESGAVLAYDPGGTTGIAGALLNFRRASSTKTMMKRAVEKDAFRTSQIEGDPEEQANHLFQMWQDFVYHAHIEKGIAIDNVVLVIEAFQLRQRDADLTPVEIIGGLKTLLRGKTGEWPWGRPVFQTPSQAMGYATNERLHEWGIWSVGLEHARDATRHVALRASKLLQGED
jgi:hypothetical protein